MLKVLKQHPKQLLNGIGLAVFSACLILFAIGLPAYLHQFYNYPLTQLYLANTLGLIWSSILLPLFGWMSDRFGRRKLLLIGVAIILPCLYPLFCLPAQHTLSALYIFMLLYQTVMSLTLACYSPMLAELFPTAVRFTGVSICYNIAFLIGSFTPFFITLISAHSHLKLSSAALFFSALILITGISAWRVKEQARQPLLT